MSVTPGPVVLLGSGETSPTIRKVYDQLFRRLQAPIHVAILETPAGFEPNSDDVAGEIGKYLVKRLQNYRPDISIIPARKRGTPLSPDNPDLLDPLYDADVLLMGPGSPTYAARQLRDSLAWQTLQACHRLGAMVIFASATTIASGVATLPVYEIYKVGEDLHWKQGLDFFGAYGLKLVFIPHWNNNDGGASLDTSHCYVGTERYNALVSMLPARVGDDFTIVGIDENTALVVEPARAECWVQGPGGVTLIRGGEERRFASGTTFAIGELGPFTRIDGPTALPQTVWETTQVNVEHARRVRQTEPTPSDDVMALVDARQTARAERNWSRSDQLRDEIAAAGWQVQDTPDGPVLEPLSTVDARAG